MSDRGINTDRWPDGEVVNGTYATCAAQVGASTWRLIRHVDPLPLVWKSFAACAGFALAVGGTAAWLILSENESVPPIVGLVLFGLAAASALLAFWLGNLLRRSVPLLKNIYRNALLTPALVVSTEPLHLVSLANMTNDGGPARRALKRFEGGRLPMPLQIGTRITCVSGFRDGPDWHTWGDFDPRPLSWGTADEEVISARTAKLGDAAFQELEALVAGGRVPETLGEHRFIDPPRLH